MARWEYFFVPHGTEFERGELVEDRRETTKILNEYGAKGWEVVLYDREILCFLLKRPLT
jgi:hypothetical protein